MLHFVLLMVGFLFILDFPMPKPNLKWLLSMIAIVSITVGIIFVYTKFRLPSPADESNPIVEELYEDCDP